MVDPKAWPYKDGEYFFDNAKIITEPSILKNTLDPKLYIECPKCGDVATIDASMVLTSYPPQYQWFCPHCGATGYIQCDEVKSIDPDTFKKTRARFATYCKICGDEILIYGDENPTVCIECKKAVVAMRKALGTWHD